MRARTCCVLVVWAWCWWSASAAPRRPACPADPRCVSAGAGHDETTYHVDGQRLYIKFNSGGYFSLECAGNVTLEHPALPRFESLQRLNHVKLLKCAAPRGSYAAALRALNVLPVERLELASVGGRLARDHLAHLDDLEALVFTNLSVARDALAAVPRLQRLRLDSVRLGDVRWLPASLREVVLVNTGVTRMERDAFAHMSSLASLIVRDDNVELHVEARAPLRELALQARAVFVHAALPDSLVNVTLYGWGERAPAPWASCGALRSLVVVGAAAEALPPGWLAHCPSLRVLSLRAAPALASLAPDALRGAHHLQHVTLSGAALRALPPELLYDAKPLLTLNLSTNNLSALTVGTFAKTKQLEEVDLSHNELTSEALGVLAAVTSLRALRLDHNARLGSACSGGVNTVHGVSPLQSLTSLARLGLRNTGARHVCRDWPDNMPHLARLDLRDNHITYVTYSDLRFAGGVTVDLRGNNVTQLLYSRRDYDELVREPERCARAHPATVRLSGALACDCRATWAALALAACPRHVLLDAARCAAPARALADVPPDELACATTDACPAACRCATRERAARPARVVRVHCERARLTALPALAPALDVAWELRLAHNNITAPRAADLPPHVLELDLRNNSVASAERAAALVRAAQRVRLGDNALSCACGDEPALVPLRALLADAPHCAGPAPALREPPACARGGPGVALAAALVPLLLAAALLGGCLARPAWRARLKTLLRGLGWLPRAAEAGDERPYDVFLSFSHLDHELVRGLLARLEGGARPYRVCVHYRDWAPGGWIPAQIAASVRRSRRTVAVVSRHFLGSAWARAEFREAYGAALREAEPRLVVVLLDEPARLPLDAELRRYLAANTYVRWGDPWFWPKLRAALPPPRGRAPATAPAPASGGGDSGASAEPLMLQLSPRTLADEAAAPDPTAPADLDSHALELSPLSPHALHEARTRDSCESLSARPPPGAVVAAA